MEKPKIICENERTWKSKHQKMYEKLKMYMALGS